MVCLLCCEFNGSDFISLSSPESLHLKISSVLFKYFRFIFEREPDFGEVCRKCWIKVEMFHLFYQRIEEIQLTIIKIQPIVVENIDIHGSMNMSNVMDNSIKFDHHHLDDNFWRDESDVSLSEFVKSEPIASNVISTMSRQDHDKSKSKSKVEKFVWKSVSKNKSAKNKTRQSIDDLKIDINDDQLKCPISRWCSKSFKTTDEVIAHCAVEHKRFHCTHCPKIRLFADLYKHLRDVHGIIENAICEHCGQIFGCNRKLQEHIKRKHTISDPVQCDICKEWFKSRETIRSHMIYVHIQGPQACGICGKISANRKALRTHLTIHSEAWKDKFKCVICGKGFRSSTKLREHSYIHSGKTDAYICQFCGKSFRFNSSISAHRMKNHPAEMAHVKERLQKKRNMEYKVK